ncbi:hypothetical protein BVRB_4g096930 [Beta vulgaris subsp. vulgaris]|uniref:Uncharacterized protein n=1 Tax=Beta vulgaris subsp. vulgaris TaxID=3555 RepID=A0A0J8B9I6_BETVV|nr:hypothetical protein BVRB_4g096930 [Beta vulgaris subsp. vulgaris]
MDCPQLSSKCPRHSATSDDNCDLDYISNLHDDILIQILDKLPMEEAVDTSLLSKRWKDIWRYKKKVELGYQWVQRTGKKVLPSLFKIFRALREQNIHSISVSLRYDLSMLTEIQSLIAYASVKNVEELYIDFNDRNDRRSRWRRRYISVLIPECELSQCSSLVKLSLKSLQLETLPPRFEALRELFLERVKLAEDSLENITNNCPSLALLSLTNCNPNADLKVIIGANSNLRCLVIREELSEVQKMTELCIRATNVKAIEFALALPRKAYQIEGTLVCSEATFRLNQMHRSRQAMRVTSLGINGKFTKNFLGLLRTLRAAEVLTLSSWCIQVLSIEVVKLQQPPIFEVRHLILETGLIRWEFRGIAYMLLGCYKLENLLIVMGAPAELKFEYMENVKYYGITMSFGKILQDLTIVEFRNYSGNYQTWDGDDFNEIQFFAGFEFGSLLVWNLKTYATGLKKLVFTTGKKRFETSQFEGFGDLFSFTHLDYCQLPCVYRSAEYRGYHR